MSWAIDERERGWPAIVVVGGRSRWLVGLPDVLFAQGSSGRTSPRIDSRSPGSDALRCARPRTRVCRPDPRFRARRVRCCRAALAGQQASTCTVMLSVCRKDPVTELGDGERHTPLLFLSAGSRHPLPASSRYETTPPSSGAGWYGCLGIDSAEGARLFPPPTPPPCTCTRAKTRDFRLPQGNPLRGRPSRVRRDFARGRGWETAWIERRLVFFRFRPASRLVRFRRVLFRRSLGKPRGCRGKQQQQQQH